MRIVFMGTPDFAEGSLKALLASGHEVAAAVTQPDRPKGRGNVMQFPPVKELAQKAGIPVYQPEKVREPGFLQEMQNLQPDVIVVVAFGQIIPREILELPKYGCVNVHASLLPKYRGAAPIQWAVINGEKTSGVTTMKMDAGLDTGDILLQREVPLAPDETGGSLFDKLRDTGAQLLLETLDALENGAVTPRPQPKDSPTAYASMLTKQMGHIDWTKSAEEIERLVRGLSPWPGTYTRLRGKTLKIWRARAAAENSAAQPAQVVLCTKRELAVQTGSGLLFLEELQLEGKKRMETELFLRGFPVSEEDQLE